MSYLSASLIWYWTSYFPIAYQSISLVVPLLFTLPQLNRAINTSEVPGPSPTTSSNSTAGQYTLVWLTLMDGGELEGLCRFPPPYAMEISGGSTAPAIMIWLVFQGQHFTKEPLGNKRHYLALRQSYTLLLLSFAGRRRLCALPYYAYTHWYYTEAP